MVLGSLSVMLVDAACRRPLVAMEPGCDVLFRLSSNLEGYADRAWAAARKEAAAKAITSLIQRDHEARAQLIATGGIAKILNLLESKVRCQIDEGVQAAVYWRVVQLSLSLSGCLFMKV